MIAANIIIHSIDYESTIRNLFPVVSEKIMAMDSKNMVLRLFQQMGDDALPVVTGVVARLPQDTKNELLIRSLNVYSPDLRKLLNREFKKSDLGRCFEIGTLSVRQKGVILLKIGQVKVDYTALMNNDYVSNAISSRLGRFTSLAKTAAGLATALAPNAVERKCLDILCKEENKARILDAIRSALDKHGICLQLDEIHFVYEEERVLHPLKFRAHLNLTEKMENDIIAALAGYLKDNSPQRT